MSLLTLTGLRTTGRRSSSLFLRLISGIQLTRQRNALRHLSDDLLDDVGLTRDQAEAEAQRSAWDVPAHWKL